MSMLQTVKTGVGLVAVLTLIASAVVAGPAPDIESVSKTSFDEVTGQLNSGGDYYLYMSTSRFLEAVPEVVRGMRNAILAEAPEGDRDVAKIRAVFDILLYLYQTSGIENLSGIGISSVEREEGLYYTRSVYHHFPGKGEGMFWSLCGGAPVTKNALDILPAETALCGYGKMDINALLNWVRSACIETGNARFAEMLDGQLEQIEQKGIPVRRILESLEGEIGVLLTVDPETTRPFEPAPGLTLQVPDIGLAIVTRTSEGTILEAVDAMTQGNANIERTESMGAQWRGTVVPSPVPVQLSPTVVQQGELLVIASKRPLAEAILATRAGKHPALANTEVFNSLSRDVPVDKAASMHFISPRLGTALREGLNQVLDQKGKDIKPGTRAGIDKVMDFYVSLLNSCGATVDTDQGFVYSANSGYSVGQMSALQNSVLPVAIMAGTLMPALAEARGKAQTVSCMSNMKQIGLATMMYSTDHDGKLPDDFGVLVKGGYLTSPQIFVCPGSGLAPAPAPDQFDPALHSSYLYFGKGVKLADIKNGSNTVVAADKRGNHNDGSINVLFVDGHVEKISAPDIDTAAMMRNFVIPGQ